MRTCFAHIVIATAATASALLATPSLAQNASPLAGVWTLNRSLSQLPSSIGFNPSWMPSSSADGRGKDASGGRGGRRPGGSGSTAPSPASLESYDDARQLRFLTEELQNPPMRLTIEDTTGAVTFTNEGGQSRTIHPDGRLETIEIQGVSFSVTSGRIGDQLVVNYHLAQSREIHYTYAATANPRQLTVDVQLLERGVGDHAKRVYDPGLATETVAPATSTASAPDSFPARGAPTTAANAVDLRPGADLRGLTRLGIVVEDLSAQSMACGLSLGAIESAVTKRLTAGGLTVRRNSDDDTYVYLNVVTHTLSGGLCVSRYDAFLYTQAPAKLSYRDQPVMAQVSLAHRGGIASGTPLASGADVVRGLENYADLFVTQIRDANK